VIARLTRAANGRVQLGGVDTPELDPADVLIRGVVTGVVRVF
jgi:hypothetical protein